MIKINPFLNGLYKIILPIFIIGMYHVMVWNELPFWNPLLLTFLGLGSVIVLLNGKIQINKYLVWIVGLSVLIIIINLFSSYTAESFVSFNNFIKVALYSYIIVINIRTKEDLKYILLCVWIAGLTVFISLYMNFDSQYIMSLDSIHATSGRMGLGGIEHPNTTAFNIYISFACGLYFYFISGKNSTKLFKLFVIIGEVCLIVGILLTGSRKVLVTLVLFPLLMVLKKNKNPIKLLVQIVVVCGGTYLLYNLMLSNDVLYNLIGYRIEDISGILSGNDASASGRNDLILEGISVGFNSIIGVGLGNFVYYSVDQAYAHNEFVEIFADLGFFGFMLYFVPIFSELYRGFSRKTKKLRELMQQELEMHYWLCMMLCILILCYFQVSYSLFSYHIILALFLSRVYKAHIECTTWGR
ncbi:O-antigen ligase family protein [Priestia megaterium]|uniref:O-antigen ligase family protein n=1 Tax=Priestia megaterium TaxID=1404 RepID=A0A6H1NWI2_PRIMG|nr:O-antigen ligase family protein [Priestia megaterium]QIZ05643.1 O-antigen ligase family protein [Priestia megaterium]